jgi:toxin ParE1/3/4
VTANYRSWRIANRLHLGLEFLDAVDAAIDQILDLPHSGSAVPRMATDLAVRRIAVKRFPYHVIYLETNAQIRVLAIAHDRRKPGYWKTRLR